MSEEETRTWRWVDVDGVESIVDEWDLLSSLTNGTLAPYTLVWRQGWAEWLPACQVAELANALPKNQVEKTVEPKLDPKAEEPPPAPVDKYHSYQAREAAAKLLGKTGKAAPPPGPLSTALAVPGVPPPQQPARPAQPTLIEGAQVSATSTLRPPGAVPPPPRGVPQATPIADPYPPSVPAPMTPLIDVVGSEGPTNPRAAAEPLPSWSDDLDAGAGAARQQAPVATYPKPKGPPLALIAMGLFAVVGVAAAVVAGVVALRSKGGAGGLAGVSSSVNLDAPRAPLVPCRLAKPAARLAPAVHPSVAPIAAALSGANKVAVGYAGDERQAEGIVVDLDTLAVERPFHQKTDHDVEGVVPITSDGDLTFEVDYESGTLRASRTIDTKPRLSMGWMDGGLATKLVGSGEPTVIWPSPSDKPTEPRVAPLPGGFAVTARRGGQSGRVVAGYLGTDGQKKSDLVEVSSKAQLGTPAIASAETNVLIAFAGRPTDESYWTLQLAVSAGSEPPRVAQNFATPPGGLGADAISPAVDGLPAGRWLLQWTEGPPGKRQVRLQTLGFDLVPVGDPLTISPDDSNAGQGVVKARGDTSLSLFLVRKGKSHELWGALLKCR